MAAGPRFASIRFSAPLIMALTPLFFSTNLIFGRDIAQDVAPFTLAFLRWVAVAAILSPVLYQHRFAIRSVLSPAGIRQLVILGFLGMWICGALVYVALDYTTATNATLLYTTSAVMIIMLEALMFGRSSSWREVIGILLAITGVLVIVVKGSMQVFLSLRFNPGDLIILFTAASWALYSVLQRRYQVARLPTLPAFGLVAFIGAALLLPFSVWEWIMLEPMPDTVRDWQSIGGIVFFASLLAFSGYQYGVRHLGPSVAGIFMYMLPVYGVSLALIFLGEALEQYHLTGAALVIGGIVLATLPKANDQPS